MRLEPLLFTTCLFIGGQIDGLQTIWQFFVTTLAWFSTKESPSDPLASCPGYEVDTILTTGYAILADLKLAGPACNSYGKDLKNLRLGVTYESGSWLPYF
jgi:hypothetical protein